MFILYSNLRSIWLMKSYIFMTATVYSYNVYWQYIKKFFLVFIYFWLCWIYIAAHGLSLDSASEGYSSCGLWAFCCSGFSCRAEALGSMGLIAVPCRLPCPMSCGISPGQGLNPCSLH